MPEAIQATATTRFPAATQPTIYFIGMTTGKSSIMRVFPAWARHLKLERAVIQGIDCKWHDDPAVYRNVVQFIKNDPLSKGALVTTHKIDLLKACRDMFEFLDPYAQLMGEASSISKRVWSLESGGLESRNPAPLTPDSKTPDSRLLLRGHAKDPISSGLALEAFLPENHWEKTGAAAFCIGAGGSSIAISCYMMDPKRGANRPSKIVVSNRSEPRLQEIKEIHHKLGCPIPVEYHHAPKAEDNDALLEKLPAGSLVMNATGLGKDAPGSPLTHAAVFPKNALAWDFNYRGDLLFLQQARAQAKERNLHVEDGWVYFIHGWTQVVAEVFNVKIPTSGAGFDEISKIAKEVR
ncbi:MAG TPA: shikimate dehydrogenase [Planctomycetota bacterium]|jgi:shikimate 5-dehydrogenase